MLKDKEAARYTTFISVLLLYLQIRDPLPKAV
jgi:hypothetical protein